MLICHRNWTVVVHALTPSRTEEYKIGGDNSLSVSFCEFLGAGSSFQIEVELRATDWLFCSSDLQVEPHCLSLGYY